MILFSVTLADCRVDTFRSGGKGGQNQNKVESGVRIVHAPSGATGEARDSRDQLHNKRAAFRRMVETKEFQRWLRAETARRLGEPSPEEIVERQMEPSNLRIEVRDTNGRWAPEKRQGALLVCDNPRCVLCGSGSDPCTIVDAAP